MITDKKLLIALYSAAFIYTVFQIGIVWKQSYKDEHDFGTKSASYVWLLFTYALLFLLCNIIERIIVVGSSNKTYLKDITLQFENLPLHQKETEFQKNCNNILPDGILEVSFIYNLKKYFKIKEKLEKNLAEKEKINDSENTALKSRVQGNI